MKKRHTWDSGLRLLLCRSRAGLLASLFTAVTQVESCWVILSQVESCWASLFTAVYSGWVIFTQVESCWGQSGHLCLLLCHSLHSEDHCLLLIARSYCHYSLTPAAAESCSRKLRGVQNSPSLGIFQRISLPGKQTGPGLPGTRQLVSNLQEVCDILWFRVFVGSDRSSGSRSVCPCVCDIFEFFTQS